MFEIKRNQYHREIPYYCLGGKENANNYLHSDGQVFGTPECFPTREDAQAVLDKFYPKPEHACEHVWEHGDVFKAAASGSVMMYLHPEKCYGERKPSVVYVSIDAYAYSKVDVYLTGAKFLFNVKEKI